MNPQDQPKIQDVTILEKAGTDGPPTKIAIRYRGRKRRQIIDDAELVPLIMLFWVAKCASVKSRIDNL